MERFFRLVEHGAVVSMESTRNPHHDISQPLDYWVACTFSSSFAGLGPRYFWIFLMSAFWTVFLATKIQSVQQVGFCGKTPKTNVPWLLWGGIVIPSCSSVECWPQPWLIESETAGCIDTLTPWGSVRLEIHDLKQVMVIDVLVSLWLESCFSSWNTTNNKSLLTVYSLRLIDTQPDSHWKLSNTFCKRTRHLSKRVPPSCVNQPIVTCNSKKSIESLLSLGISAKAFKARPGHETKWNNHGFLDSFQRFWLVY